MSNLSRFLKENKKVKENTKYDSLELYLATKKIRCTN